MTQHPWDATIELGECGMGMPVIRSNQKLRTMGIGEILQISSAHP
jgi:TusA-related sulfurtransferase